MKPADISSDRLHLAAPGRLAAGAALVAVVGLGATLAGGALGAPAFWSSWLVAWTFFLSITLGGLFFVLIQFLVRAGWSVVVRRLAEVVAATFPLLLVLGLPVVFGLGHLYPWTDPEVVAASPPLQAKAAWLDVPFFLVRLAVVFLVWGGLGAWFLRQSTAQDADGDPARTLRMQAVSAPAVIVYALTLTVAAFDLLMSLEPEWYSTIFGVYLFAGGFDAFLAVAVIAVFLLQRTGHLQQAITPEHTHDLGKLMFAFVVFWAYIAFSQYMLIWYSNIPEETVFYLHRQEHGWGGVSLALLFGHFFLPFLAILSRYPKRRPGLLAAVAAWILLMHALDLAWIVYPPTGMVHPTLPWTLVTALVGMGAAWVAMAALLLRRRALLPVRDPRLPESLAFENV